MASNLMAGRMRDRIQIETSCSSLDEWGLQVDGYALTKLSANILVKSGDMNEKYGVDLESEVITCLCRYRQDIESGMTFKWLGRGRNKTYKVSHIKPTDDFKGMIITGVLQP